jgi:hypothetical protein
MSSVTILGSGRKKTTVKKTVRKQSGGSKSKKKTTRKQKGRGGESKSIFDQIKNLDFDKDIISYDPLKDLKSFDLGVNKKPKRQLVDELPDSFYEPSPRINNPSSLARARKLIKDFKPATRAQEALRKSGAHTKGIGKVADGLLSFGKMLGFGNDIIVTPAMNGGKKGIRIKAAPRKKLNY